jgi:hypothetical protein
VVSAQETLKGVKAMTNANTPARQRRPVADTARLGKEIYEKDIRHLVEADHQGEVVAIDIDSGGYALGENAIAASERLRARHPEAEVWLMRVGHRTLYRFGGSSLRRVG